MTEHKTMNTIIHAAFRRDLCRFDGALGDFPTGSRDRADQLATAWKNFSYQLHHHHQDEETIFWPILRDLGATNSLMGELEGEHGHMLRALEAADSSMKALELDPSEENTSNARAAITALEHVLLSHLAHEERDIEPISAANHASSQMKGAQKTVRKAHKGNTGTLFTWLLDGADPAAKAGLRREVPPPVLFVITRFAGRDYTRLVASAWR